MDEFYYTLVTDGSSDTALLPILDWLLQIQGIRVSIQSQWADLRRVRWPGKPSLADKVSSALRQYPCDLLFVHRDAETEPRENRIEEIKRAVERVKQSQTISPAVCVIPVRMQEAWLLFDEDAIKQAAGNRSYSGSLNLPAPHVLESLPDPKTELYERLRQAADLSSRRRKKQPVRRQARRVADFIDNFSPLRNLPAFAALEDDVRQVIREYGWVT